MAIDKNTVNKQVNQPVQNQQMKKPLILQKHLIIFFTFFGSFIMCFLRYNLSVAIVAIIDEVEEVKVYNNSLANQTDDYTLITRKKYDWDENIQGHILGSYFYGYTFFQLPFGRLGEKYGTKWIIALGVVGSGILTFITPLMIDLGIGYLIFLRVFIGALQAAILCNFYTLYYLWLPKESIITGITLANVGFELGGMVTLFLTGYVCSIDYLGWRYAFYLFGFVPIVWFFPYCFLIYSTPEEHPRLCSYEKKLIDQRKAMENSQKDYSSKLIRVPPKLDFKKILTSGPVWASSASKFCSALGYYVITTKMPSYLNEVFKVSLKDNGIFSALPYLGVVISKLICLKLTNYLISLNVMSLTNVRKLFQAFSMFIPTICLFMITYKCDNLNFAIFMIVLALFGQGFVCGGDAPIVSEFAQDLSGSIFGLTNQFACSNGFLAPLIVGYIIQSFDDIMLGWNVVFYISSFTYFVGGLIFLTFASAEPQPWAVAQFKEVDNS